VLIYALSLWIRPSFKLNIHNQCVNIDLVSPVYVTSDGLECHRAPDHKVCAGHTMRSSFIIKPDNASYGALICKLQRKQIHESTEVGENTSSTVHLLVVWKISESNESYTDVLLVGYDEKLDKDDLRKLYCENSGRFRLCPNFATETWLLSDNITLMTKVKIMNEGHLLNIIISEVEKDHSTRIPTYIDSER
jgi:hypothetical protein